MAVDILFLPLPVALGMGALYALLFLQGAPAHAARWVATRHRYLALSP